MRRALTALSVVGLALALSVPATAATPSPARMAGQIRTLQKQVKTLQTTVKKLTKTLQNTEVLAVAAFFYGGCSTAATADALQGSNPTAFGNTPVNDYQSCSDLSQVTGTTIARQPNTATVNVFQTLLTLFK
jgi:hypothetical protein